MQSSSASKTLQLSNAQKLQLDATTSKEKNGEQKPNSIPLTAHVQMGVGFVLWPNGSDETVKPVARMMRFWPVSCVSNQVPKQLFQ
jgi:hypothetical protein